jgi:hypothetical protein
MTELLLSLTVNKDLAALLVGIRLSNNREFLDIKKGSGLRDS